MDLLEENAGDNAHEFTVSELSGALKRDIEERFGRIRVRGEIGRVSRPSSGHLYFDLKDDRSVLASVTWKGQASKLAQRPEEGMEVVATGRMTTFPGQSKYQLIVDQIEPAGMGALMAMLEKRRKALAEEGLFDEARKRPLPFLPRVIGVVTSPSGAVIRDILHRLRDRFPTHVLIWPVAVQGSSCASQVASAIRGFNELSGSSAVPRPDLIIVARGGGSIEDLWGFNEEDVVRAAAASEIPLISAVGHETDTTLIDFASDRRAPTPTAAAELAVPVRSDLAARLIESGGRLYRASGQRIERQRQRLRDLSRAMGRPAAVIEGPRQRLDLCGTRLEPALRGLVRTRRQQFVSRPIPAASLRHFTFGKRQSLEFNAKQLQKVVQSQIVRQDDRLAQLQGRVNSSLRRVIMVTRKLIEDRSAQLAILAHRMDRAVARLTDQRQEALVRLDRMRLSLGYKQTLKRGFAVVHGPDGVVTTGEVAGKLAQFEIEFTDGRICAAPTGVRTPRQSKKSDVPQQGSLF